MGHSSNDGGFAALVRNVRTPAAIWLVGLSALLATAHGQAPAGGDPEGMEVLTRGPVHEAFAVPVVNDPKPGLVVAKAPPQAIEEMPPDQKPAGDDVQWIPGYWSWDQSRTDFIWVSGIWREPPPGRQWVPGYWNPVANGSQWVPGAWIPVGGPAQLDADVTTVQGEAVYLPEPPTSLEAGPNIPQPSGEVFWSPGCWFWRQTRYVWRPGFWAAVQPTWVWVPAHYVWTPGGCLFVEGYWDMPLVDRGILFAPVYYAQPVYLRPAYVYTPSITIAAPGLVANLFVQPSYNHYCFGDYYDQTFITAGVFPWFSFTYASGPRPPAYYDPLFTFYASVNIRSNPGWMNRCRDDYIQRRDNVAMRPPRTYIEQTRIVQNNVNITNNVTIINNGRGGRPGPGPAAMIGRPIEQVAMRAEGGGPRMQRLDVDARRQWRTRSQALADFRVQRAGREVEAAPRPGPGGPGPQPGQARPRPFAMAASPVAAPRMDRPTAERPMRRPEVAGPNASPPTRQPFARPDAPAMRPERPNGPVAKAERPAAARPEGPLTRGPAQRPGPRNDPDALRSALQRQPNAAGPLPAARPAQAAARPFPPGPNREGPAARPLTRPAAAAAAPEAPNRMIPRRPPPTPRPTGPAQRPPGFGPGGPGNGQQRPVGPGVGPGQHPGGPGLTPAQRAAARRNAAEGEGRPHRPNP